MKPFVCPKCNGERVIPVPESYEHRKCPTCGGTGVVWDRQQAAPVKGIPSLPKPEYVPAPTERPLKPWVERFPHPLTPPMVWLERWVPPESPYCAPPYQYHFEGGRSKSDVYV